jgi:hypothetical protein
VREFKGGGNGFAVSLGAFVLDADFNWTLMKTIRQANNQ